MKSRLLSLSCLGLLAVAVSSPRAADTTWDGAGVATAESNQWSFAQNWAGDSAPANGDNLTFSGTAKPTSTNDFLSSIGWLTFGAGGFVLNGDALAINGGITNVTGNNTVNLGLTLGAAQSFHSATGTLLIGGPVNNSGFALTADGAANVTLAGALSGSGGLVKNGAGTLLMSGVNSGFSGAVSVNGGTLVAATNAALGTGPVTVGGATLQVYTNLFGGGAGTVTLNGGGALLVSGYALDQATVDTVASGSQGGVILMGANSANSLDLATPGLTNVFLGATGNVRLDGTLTPVAGRYLLGGGNVNYYFSGNTGLTVTNLTGANDVVVGQPGLVSLTTNADYTGNTVISNRGAVRVDGEFFGAVPGAPVANNITLDNGVIRFGPATLTLNANRGLYLAAGGGEFHPWSSANVTVAGVVSGPGGWSRTDSGAMTFTASNTYSGPVSNTVGGTVTFANDGSLGLPSSVLHAAGTMNVNGGNPLATPAIVVTNATLNLNGASALGGGTLDVRTGGNVYVNANAALGAATAQVQAGALLQVGNAAYLPGTNAVTVLNNGRYFANYANAGQETLATANTNSTGTLVLGGATSANLDFSAHPGLFLGASGNYTYGGTITPAGTTYLLGGGNNSPAVSANTFLTVTNLSGARNVVIGQPGTVTLDTGNTFSGNITVSNGGWLVVRNDAFAPVPGALVADYLTLDGGKLRTYNGATGFAANRGVRLASGTNEIHVWGGNTFNIAGPVSGPGAIVTTDGGTLRLSASNTFSGILLINAGTVYVNDDAGFGQAGGPIAIGNNAGIRVANTTTLANRPITINGSGTINIDGGATVTVTNPVAGGGSLVKQGAGTLVSAAAHTYSGNTTIGNGILQLGAAGGIPNGAGRGNVQIDAAGMLDLNGFSKTINGLFGSGRVTNSAGGAVTLTVGDNNQGGSFGGQILGSTALAKTGTGNWTVTSAQPATGAVAVNQGTLTLDRGSLAGPVSIAAGATLAVSGTGLNGSYYNVAPNAANFVSLTALTNHLAGQTVALSSPSSAAGTFFDFGNSGAGFPAPYNSGATQFEVLWTGKYLAPSNGVYTFGTSSDDGSMIFVNGAVVVSNNYFQGVTYRSGTVSLAPGLHDIAIAFYQGTGGYGMRASNAIPGGAVTLLPNASLLSPGDSAIGSLSGAAGATLSLGSLVGNRLTVNQSSDDLYDGVLTGVAGAKLTKSGSAELTLGQRSPGYAGDVEVTGGRLALRNQDGAGTGTIALNGGALALDTAGLLEGRVTNAFNTTDPNPATTVRLDTRYANIQDTGPYNATGGAWTDNSTYIYSGRIVNSGPTNVAWSFAENFDDSVLLKIDGANVLNNGGWNAPTLGTVTLTPGDHVFELRLGQGGGGVGPVVSSWWNTNGLGVGYDPLGRGLSSNIYYQAIVDPGAGSLLVHDFAISNAVTLAGTETVDLPNPYGVGTLAGSISGAGGLTKTGPGPLVLAGANAYGGATIVSNGVLRFGSTGAIPSTSDITLAGGATLDLNGFNGAARTVAMRAGSRLVSAAGAGSLSLDGTGTALSLQGGVNNAAAGVSRINLTSGSGGSIVVSGGSGVAALGNPLDLGAVTRTFDVADVNAGGDDLQMSGVISGAGGLLKTGAGTLTLGATNAYGGATIVGAGTLKLSYGAPIAGSALWLDAADASTLATNGAGDVSQWSDKSGNNRNATQGTAANQPLYTENALLDGKPVVRFASASSDNLAVDLSFLNGSRYTIFALEGRNGTGNYYYLGTQTAAANQGLHVGYRNDTTFTLAQYGNDLNYTGVPGFTTQVFREWTTELSATGHAIYLDGTQVLTNNNTQGLVNPGPGRVGTGFGNQYYNGDLAEILVYPSGLTDDERKAVEAYLSLKWFGGSILPESTPVQIASGATLDLNGMDQTVASLSDYAGGGGTVTNGMSGSTIHLVLRSDGGTSTFSGAIADGGPAGALSLVKDGTFTQVLSGSLAYSGTTTVSNGALVVNGAHSGGGLYSVLGGATLGGSGTVAAVTLASGGTLAPGNSPGLMTVNGDLEAQAGSFVNFELASTNSYDRLIGIGNLVLAGAVNVTLIDDFIPQPGNRFDLFDWSGSIDTNGVALNLPALSGSLAWKTDDFAVDGVIEVIPEPATAGLLGLALVAALLRRRRG